MEKDKSSMEKFLELFPEHRLAKDIFEVVEGGRIDYLLMEEYKGLRKDIKKVSETFLKKRPAINSLRGKEAVLEYVLQKSFGREPDIEEKYRATSEKAYGIFGSVRKKGATVEDSARATADIYFLLDDYLPRMNAPGTPAEGPGTGEGEGKGSGKGRGRGRGEGEGDGEVGSKEGEMGKADGPGAEAGGQGKGKGERSGTGDGREKGKGRGDEEGSGAGERKGEGSGKGEEGKRDGSGEGKIQDKQYKGIEGVPYRGSIIPGLVEMRKRMEDGSGKGKGKGQGKGKNGSWGRGKSGGEKGVPGSFRGRVEDGQLVFGGAGEAGESEGTFTYDEWDCNISGYKKDWVSVKELAMSGGDGSFVSQTLSDYSGMIKSIRRQFQLLKPEALKKVRGELDGEEVDIDAAIGSLIDKMAGSSPSERVYIRRQKDERDISVAFLVDVSRSTGENVNGKRRIDTEKEALLLMAEAIEAIGDNYAVYGFSGSTRANVEFYTVKEFGEKYNETVRKRIDGMEPQIANRDGTAIRHALRKLSEQGSKTKLLVVISDGRPADIEYYDEGAYDELEYFNEYGMEDTRMALLEAKKQGIDTFCITIDPEAREYIEKMYDGSKYTIISDIEELPERLVNIYRKLTT